MAVQESSTTETRQSEGQGGTQGGAHPAGTKGWVKKHPLAAAGLGLAGGILLLSHKGGKSGGTQDQLAAAQAAQLQAAQAASILPAAQAPASVPNEADPPSGITTPGSGSIGNGADVPGEVADPSQAAAATADASADISAAAATGALTQAVDAEAAADAAAGKNAATTHGGGTRKRPAGRHPGKGRHPTKAQHHHNTGHTGTTVHGRHFPGATGHHTGPPRRDGRGVVRQDVHVHYGGRTDVHTSINHGSVWHDHTPGHNPPSRGVPHRTEAQAPHARSQPAAPPPAHHAPPAAHHAPPPHRGRR